MEAVESNKTKHTLYLMRGDYARLSEQYPQGGAARIIRYLVHKHVQDIDNAAGPLNVDELETEFEGEL